MPTVQEDSYLAHYGILRKSGRYPWGSGANPNQRSKSFLDIIEQHRRDGLKDKDIVALYDKTDKEDPYGPNSFPFTTTDLRALKSISSNLQKQEQIRTAIKLREKGMSPSEIARQMSTPEKKVNESTVRGFLEPGRLERLDVLQSTAEMLKRQVEEKGMIDIGSNVHRDLPIGDGPNIGISPDKFNIAVAMLKEEGYGVHTFRAPQVGTGEMTTYRVLTKPGIDRRQAFANRDDVRLISEKSNDGGNTFLGIKPPLHIPASRVGIRYKEDGGADADGVIYVRPGVKDISLGKAKYAQVRIAIDGTHFLKGMAVYKDDLPKGVDLQFNTNKSNTGNKKDAMKPLKDDPDNPFGAVIKLNGQILDKDGNVTSAMNIINEQGDWAKWSKNISRQVLSKQSPDVAESQLALTHEQRRKEFEELKGLTNPLIRKKLIETFAEETDSAAVHLKAAAMPGQASKVILPANSVKPNEIFAPTYKDGDRVVLIRYPHAGTFEIPELTVNNRNKEAIDLFKGKDAQDAVVIHPKVAERLSGADFDGDAVVVIPNHKGQIKTTHALDELKGFDPQHYKVDKGPKTKKYPDGTPIITPQRKQQEMGNITNLIADMTLLGAPTHEIARAVKHSMVVIDSEKHNLDFNASARDNGINKLKREYQGVGEKGNLRGASTLITRATSQTHVVKRKARRAAEGGPIDRETGEKKYVPTGEKKKVQVTGPDGKKRFVETDEPATFRSKKLAETDDAWTLVSDHGGTRIEHIYADHSNRLKAMANEARKEAINTELPKRNPSATKAYRAEVDSLDRKLNTALLNSPLERKAQLVANAWVAQKKRDKPEMERDELKKIKGQALTEARFRTGAGKTRVVIEPNEWKAIQAGAISNDKLGKILQNSDVDELKKLATPRVRPVLTSNATARAKSMLASGYSLADVADQLGISLSTLQSGVEEGVI